MTPILTTNGFSKPTTINLSYVDDKVVEEDERSCYHNDDYDEDYLYNLLDDSE